MLNKLFDFAPVDIPIEGELKPIEAALVRSVRNLEISMIKLSTILITAILLASAMWGIGGYVFANKLEEYSSTIKTTVQMEVEIRNLKDRVTSLEQKK